jgi:hypothetical protein
MLDMWVQEMTALMTLMPRRHHSCQPLHWQPCRCLLIPVECWHPCHQCLCHPRCVSTDCHLWAAHPVLQMTGAVHHLLCNTRICHR